jgi:Domain of unknown function (DUF397)
MTILNWRKATYSRSMHNCVEVGSGQGMVAVRDSKDPDGPAIDVNPRAWLEFTEHVKRTAPRPQRH